MFLPWLNFTVHSVAELLWYLHVSPPPTTVSNTTQQEALSVAPPDASGNDVLLTEETIGNSKLFLTPSPEIAILESPPPSLFAIIIGINKYKDHRVHNLLGAVADADEVVKFLISECGAAKDRLINLRDEEATRQAIIDAIKDLSLNPAISAKDPILIYYAGHGGEKILQASKWRAGEKIQMLLPHNFALDGSNDRQSQGLFDVTLSNLLADLATKKSDNITVILDCCHSGSGTRNTQDETTLFRGIELPQNYTVPDIFLDESYGERASGMNIADEKRGLRSHVLLAGCMKEQRARETNGRGAFTSALLDLLKDKGVHQLTYKDTILHMPDLPSQNPQCEGINQDRILFKSEVVKRYRHRYSIQETPNYPGSFTLKAGEAHGITKGAKFDVYSDGNMTSLIGCVVAERTDLFNTYCAVDGDVTLDLSQPAFAFQTRVGEGQNMRLFIEANDEFLQLFSRLANEIHRPNQRSFHIVDNVTEARPHLAITTENSWVHFHVMEDTCRKFGLLRMPYTVRVDQTERLCYILRCAADFYWNLHHSRTSLSGPSLASKVTVECVKVIRTGMITDDFDEIYEMDSAHHNFNDNGIIYIDVDDAAHYCYIVNNISNVALYAALFYFDISDLSVEAYYLPGVAANGQSDISIPAKGSLKIGLGESGSVPHFYFLRDGQNVDVGFLKLYLSTEYIDYSDFAQSSPMNTDRASDAAKRRKTGLWDTLKIPMIQRKGKEVIKVDSEHSEVQNEDFGAIFA